MSEEIKSALERALERAEKLGKASKDELKRLEAVPLGNAIAARYLKGEVADLQAELSKHGAEMSRFLMEGLLGTFLKNMNLPQSPAAKGTNAKAMQGVIALEGAKGPVREIFSQMEQLFNSYEKSLQQAFLRLKQEFEAKLGDAKRAMEAQTGTPVSLDVERHPQFQEEWRRVRAQLDSQYGQVLEQHKQRLLTFHKAGAKQR